MVHHRGWNAPIALALCCAALAVGLALTQTVGKPANLTDMTAREAASQSQALPETAYGGNGDFAAAPAHDFSAIVERPLFNKSRRPETDEQPLAEAAIVTARPDLLLRGTVVVNGGRHVALMQVPGSNSIVRVVEGQAIEGWTVRRVESQRIVLEQRGGTVEFSLDEAYRKQGNSAKRPPRKSAAATRPTTKRPTTAAAAASRDRRHVGEMKMPTSGQD